MGLKPGWLICQPKILLHSYEETSVSKGFSNAYVSLFVLFTYICLTATESSLQSKSLALCKWQPLLPLLESSTPRRWGSKFFIIQCVKPRAIRCPHQPPTRSVNTVSVDQGSTTTSGTTKQFVPLDRVFKRIIYIRQINLKKRLHYTFIFIFSAVCDF